MEQIRYVLPEDRQFWFSLDRHLPRQEFDRKVASKMGYVFLRDGQSVGLMRWQLFWDSIPFCTMLYFRQDCRGLGYGRHLMAHWEEEMKAQGHTMVLTSTQVDEQAQHFYRKLGYRDCGGLLMELPGHEQPMELFLCKAL